MSDIAIIHTGVGNVASLAACFRRLGRPARLVTSRQQIEVASRLVLPGVGAFGAAMERLEELDLVETLRQRFATNQPTLAICLGMQLLGRGSEEGEHCSGIGIVDSVAKRFDDSVLVPQIGWNNVKADADCQLLQDGDAYFANSFRWNDSDISATSKQKSPNGAQADFTALQNDGWKIATADHGGTFIAAIERGSVLACQFHPELSGGFGNALLSRWIQKGEYQC
ncbi:MAG: imidazole glycerol phosphate synthase subunit HisH [Planctomycetes bacterium]|nr:imidazole glycerol phosphate synthase subunit HisH [Planctomycetota bacterium]